MKKFLCVVLVVGMVCAANAADFNVRLEGDSTTYSVYGQVTGGNRGLALVGFDIVFTVGAATTPMAPGPVMGNFVKDAGLTNPGVFGGTIVGNDLVQVGGAQNTINNDPGNAPYPIGAVDPTFALAAEVLIATGECWDCEEIKLRNCFANVIDDDETGPQYAVSPATIVYGNTTHMCCNGWLCYCRDVNCDGGIDSLDLGVVKNPANWLMVPPANPLADVNRDGYVDSLDLGAIKNPAYWLTNPQPGGCTCSYYTPDYATDCPYE